MMLATPSKRWPASSYDAFVLVLLVGYLLATFGWQLTFADVTESSDSAQATPYETWRTTYTDGSVDERTDHNDYALVQQSGAWKIQTDVQPDSQLISPSTGTGNPGAQLGTPASTASTSSNWSGYVANGGSFTSVTGSCVVPSV